MPGRSSFIHQPFHLPVSYSSLICILSPKVQSVSVLKNSAVCNGNRQSRNSLRVKTYSKSAHFSVHFLSKFTKLASSVYLNLKRTYDKAL